MNPKPHPLPPDLHHRRVKQRCSLLIATVPSGRRVRTDVRFCRVQGLGLWGFLTIRMPTRCTRAGNAIDRACSTWTSSALASARAISCLSAREHAIVTDRVQRRDGSGTHATVHGNDAAAWYLPPEVSACKGFLVLGFRRVLSLGSSPNQEGANALHAAHEQRGIPQRVRVVSAQEQAG